MNLKDIKVIQITNDMLDQAYSDALHLGQENYGYKTKVGSSDYDVKGSLAQQAVHIYLDNTLTPHEYSPPYITKNYGDDGDIKIYGETYDVKCRGLWNEKYFFNQTYLIGKHEKDNRTDNYIFTTIDADKKNIYILGAITKHDLFKFLANVSYEGLKFDSAGKIHVKYFKPLLAFINHI